MKHKFKKGNSYGYSQTHPDRPKVPKSFGIRFYQDQAEQMQAIAEASGKSFTDVCREMADFYLNYNA